VVTRLAIYPLQENLFGCYRVPLRFTVTVKL